MHDHRGLGRAAGRRVDLLQRVQRDRRDLAEAGREAERVGQAARDDLIDDADVDEVRQIVLGRSLGGRKRDAGGKRALHRKNAGFRQPIDFGSADVGLRLRVGEHGLELRAAHRLDAAGRIDLFEREQRALAALLAFIGETAGDRMQNADLQALALRTQDRGHADARHCDARGSDQDATPGET